MRDNHEKITGLYVAHFWNTDGMRVISGIDYRERPYRSNAYFHFHSDTDSKSDYCFYANVYAHFHSRRCPYAYAYFHSRRCPYAHAHFHSRRCPYAHAYFHSRHCPYAHAYFRSGSYRETGLYQFF